MKTTFLGQGLENSSDNAIGYHLVKYLTAVDFHSFTGISAFASQAGIFGLSGYIQNAKKFFKNLTLIVGIDQEGTSKEALNEILKLDINSYIFYQNESPIFHPKIYLFEGDNIIKIIVGSSNLTGRGLFTNVESSLLIEFDSNDAEGAALLIEFKTYYKSLLDFSDPNLFEVSDVTISDFMAKGIIPDEAERKKAYSKKIINTQVAGVGLPGIIVPQRLTAKIPSSFPKSRNNANASQSAIISTPVSTVITQPVLTSSTAYPQNLVWQKLSLSQSDAQQVSSGTAVTANLKLSQANFRINNILIDQKTYFRNQIFNNLVWAKTKASSNTYEEVLSPFDIAIFGTPIGIHTLKLSHDAVRIAGQGNTPTWLHWGSTVMPYLLQKNITGKTLNLYQANQTFFIEIV
jgi:HKD family nuclease